MLELFAGRQNLTCLGIDFQLADMSDFATLLMGYPNRDTPEDAFADLDFRFFGRETLPAV